MTLRRPFTRAFSLLLLLALPLAASGQSEPPVGSRIVDYVAELRGEGINVIYSDELLTPSMRVRSVPDGDRPLARLRGILEPYGLELRPGPRGSWLVARSEPPLAPRDASAPPAPVPPAPPPLEDVVVSASRYAVSRSTAPSSHWLRFDHDAGRFSGTYLVARSRIDATRGGSIDDSSRSTGALADARRFEVDTLKARLRASWGRYFQAQSLDELQASDGVDQLFPPQESEHLGLGFETLLGANAALRVEAYRKEFEALRPRFENLYARVSLLPELLPDRMRIDPLHGEATGTEVAVDGETGAWDWWASWSRANVRDRFPSARISRSWEETWSVKGGGTWIGERWAFAVAATAHSGWPATTLGFLLEF